MMEFFIAGRVAGKTFQLLRQMADDEQVVMICHSEQACQWTWQTARDQGFDIDRERFIPAEGAYRRLRGRRNLTAVVDNIDLVLPLLLGVEVTHGTATGTVITSQPEVLGG